MKKIISSIALLTSLCFIGCQKDLTMQEAVQPPQSIDESHYYEPSKELLASYDALRNPSALSTRAACDWIEIPAGSVDALAQAVNNACAGGVIYFKTGMHTETKQITITKSVKIIGQAGAVLKIKSSLRSSNPVTGNITPNVALHIFNAPRTLIQDLDIQPIDADGGAAILIENSLESAVMRNKISNFQSGVMIEKSDRMTIMQNTIKVSGAWQTGQVDLAIGIIVINGKSAYLALNTITNAITGLFASDQWGTSFQNTTSGNFLGMILCNAPKTLMLPSGQLTGSLIPATGWKFNNNNSTDNINVGYVVIDGANRNILENNNAARNGSYDMELTSDSYRFGFFTPLSFDNTVNAGIYPNIRIKDCGLNNKVTGGIRINTTTDPCN